MIYIPDYWLDFISKNNLSNKSFEIPDDFDLSGLGADFKVFARSEIDDETSNYYPGINVVKSGYIAVACCLCGSGDPYFINVNDGENGKLYRVYHDDNSIDIVVNNYKDILKFAEPEN
ncbi:hypothetical protein OPW36_13040 [Vibrio europaeus]|uniref:Uncharacterized protein n=1 Tax=Vibrio europaeus TaxID=300876 RepID=A0AAE7B1F1_9VIBR|nr:hypothetical protein [Vibrio europaeus]MDC5806206.1 hypothetical protein [Vibrio europaeus]MDC5812520.1 hypothetical protein [Vibrio europaeus]MDC5825636.1 hypothetical protein [Vibrio europaeus]MDC5831084.1 hypothetical protein [Vibrio europaeus]MDC5834040.1 hypothetical protein [Vibrio europaeus]